MDFVKRTWAEISLDAIERNFHTIQDKIGGRAKICCARWTRSSATFIQYRIKSAAEQKSAAL